MAYVTQGTVQAITIPTTAGVSELEIKINPRQDYAVKHNGNNYILFMPVGPGAGAKVLEVSAATGRPDVKDSVLVEALINAAFNSTNIEIMVDIVGKDISIKSIKIPATLLLDTV